MMTNQPNTTPDANPKIIAKTFLSLIARNAATNERIAIKPKITINKFMKNITLLSTSKEYVGKTIFLLYFIATVIKCRVLKVTFI